MLLEKGAAVDAVDEVSAWEYGRVQEHGHACESAGLLEVRGSVWCAAKGGHWRQVLIQPWCCAAVQQAAAALGQRRRTH